MKNGFKYLNDICNTSYMPTNIAKQNAWELNHDQKTKIFKSISKKKKKLCSKSICTNTGNSCFIQKEYKSKEKKKLIFVYFPYPLGIGNKIMNKNLLICDLVKRKKKHFMFIVNNFQWRFWLLRLLQRQNN